MGSGRGNLIEALYASVSQCVAQCNGLEACVGFTYFTDRGECKLKSAIGTQTASDDRNTYVKEGKISSIISLRITYLTCIQLFHRYLIYQKIASRLKEGKLIRYTGILMSHPISHYQASKGQFWD